MEEKKEVYIDHDIEAKIQEKVSIIRDESRRRGGLVTVRSKYPCRHCAEYYNVKPSLLDRSEYCNKDECRDAARKVANERRYRKNQEMSTALKEFATDTPELNVNESSPFRGNYSRSSSANNMCEACVMYTLCNERIDIGMWIGCEVPTRGDLIRILTSNKWEECIDMLARTGSLLDRYQETLEREAGYKFPNNIFLRNREFSKSLMSGSGFNKDEISRYSRDEDFDILD